VTEQRVGVVRPLPGEGVVAHLNGLLLVCATGQPVEELLAALNDTAVTGGDGRALARRVAQVLARAMERSLSGEPVSCAVAGPANGGIAVLVSGAAVASVSGGPDGEVRLAGRDALTWTDRLVTGPVSRVELRLPGAGQPGPFARLDGGVVPGAGVECDYTQHGELAFPPLGVVPQQNHPQPVHQTGAQDPIAPRGPVVPPPPSPMPSPGRDPLSPSFQLPGTPDAAEPASGPLPPGPVSGPLPAYVSGPLPAPGPSSGPHPVQAPGPASGPQPVLDRPPEEEQPRQENRAGAGPGQEDDPSGATRFDLGAQPEPRPMVYGVDCPNGHFNDPRASTCAVCGTAIDQRSVVPYQGPRPQLGVLVLDDGTTLPLDGDYLIGRDPERAAEVKSGEARPVRVTSPDGSVSRRHVRVALDNWDVTLIDLGSVNGTQIQPPGDPNFYDIRPNEPVPIVPGTTVRVGVSRTLRYEARRNA